MTDDSISTFKRDVRGVSDAIGYILLISVVLVSITATATFAGPVISEQQDEQYISNSVRAFEVFSENLKEIERDRSPSRATEIRYKGGTLFEESDLFMRVNVTHSGSTTTHIIAGTPVSYRKGDSAVHYEMGSVIREDNGEYTMRKEPPFQFSEGQTRMSVVSTTVTDDQITLNRGGKLVIVSRHTGTRTRSYIEGNSSHPVEVNLTLSTPRYELWRDYFDSKGATIKNVDATNNEISVSFTTESFVFRETLIRVNTKR